MGTVIVTTVIDIATFFKELARFDGMDRFVRVKRPQVQSRDTKGKGARRDNEKKAKNS